jgi:hypothetical protein
LPKRIITALALIATLLVPSTAMAAPKFAGLTYDTTARGGSDYEALPATVAGLHFERNQFGEVCAVFNVTVHGSFQFWTGAEFVTMTQNPPAQRQENCFTPSTTQIFLLGAGPDPGALSCATGTFDLTRWTNRAGSLTFRGSDSSFYFTSATLDPLVLTATTDDQREAICDLEARLMRLPDRRLAAELNDLLALFSAT